jgi:hypothetical protein
MHLVVVDMVVVVVVGSQTSLARFDGSLVVVDWDETQPRSDKHPGTEGPF